MIILISVCNGPGRGVVSRSPGKQRLAKTYNIPCPHEVYGPIGETDLINQECLI